MFALICRAYLDMLEVGVTCCPVGGGKERKGFPTLSYVEARWHFAQPYSYGEVLR